MASDERGMDFVDRDQPREELRPSYSSSEPESIHLDSESEHSQDSELESRGSVHGNPPFGSKSHVAPDFEPSSDLCTSYRVISNSSALSQLEGKRGVAQVDEAHCTATPVLNDSAMHPLSIDITSHDLEYGAVEALVDWNLKESSTLSEFTKTPSASPYLEESAPTLIMSTVPFRPSYYSIYDYMNDIDDFVSDEEEGEICDESTTLSPPSSLVPETSHSSYGMPDHSPAKEPSAMMHFEAQELRHSLVSLESESPIESESKMLEIWSLLRILLTQSYPLSLTRALSSSFEPDCRSQVVIRPQRFLARSARASNLEIVHTSLRRSFVKLDEGVERYAVDVDYVHTEAADLPIIQVPLREIHETSIQSAPKRDFGHITRIVKLKLVPALSYEFSMTSSGPQTIQIENPSRSMLIRSGFDLNVENVLQAPELALRNEGLWMVSSRSTKNSREHVKFCLGILPSMVIWKNSTQRASPLFIYLVIWAPKNYIAHVARCYYGVRQAKVAAAGVHAWNQLSLMIRESKAQKPRPVGLDNSMDRGIVSDTTCLSISRSDIRVFENPEYESQKPRPASQNENRAQATLAEDGFQRS